MPDVSDHLWRAVAGRAGGTPPRDLADAVAFMEDRGATRKEIAQFKKDVAAELGVSVREIQRKTTRTGRERRGAGRHADRIREIAAKDPRVRAATRSPRRTARMRNKGARVRIDGPQGPRIGRSWPTRQRVITETIDPYAMEAIIDAWEAGDDDAALAALQDALEDSGYPPNWSWEDDASVDFLGLSRD